MSLRFAQIDRQFSHWRLAEFACSGWPGLAPAGDLLSCCTSGVPAQKKVSKETCPHYLDAGREAVNSLSLRERAGVRGQRRGRHQCARNRPHASKEAVPPSSSPSPASGRRNSFQRPARALLPVVCEGANSLPKPRLPPAAKTPEPFNCWQRLCISSQSPASPRSPCPSRCTQCVCAKAPPSRWERKTALMLSASSRPYQRPSG